jgi:pimeloyl-ACP methyl ester carboxylesterase
MRRGRLALVALSAALLTTPLVPAASAAAAQTCGGSGAATSLNGSLPDGATYLIQCPGGAWNGTLFLDSHGYVTPGSANPAQDAGDPVTASWLLSQGYALAGSSYATTGWAIQQALPDQIGTLDAFGQAYRTPDRTIAWGHSLGGIITAGLIQQYPGRFSAALPMCGVLSGGVATWNTALDAAFAFQQLLDPSVQVTGITNPTGNLNNAETAETAAQSTPQGRARLALAAALGDTPGWFNPLFAGTGPQRLHRPGSQPVPVGHPGRLPVHLRVPGRTRSPGRPEPVVEHGRELLRAAGQVGGPRRSSRAVSRRRAELER